MICIDNSEWPPHCFSNEKTLPWINLLRQCSPEHHHAPAGQAKIPKVSTRVAPSRSQASAGLILIPTKARGLLSGTMNRGTLIRGLNRPKNINTCLATGPTKAYSLPPIRRKGNDSKKPNPRPKNTVRPIRTPSNPRDNLHLARGLPAKTLNSAARLHLARG